MSGAMLSIVSVRAAGVKEWEECCAGCAHATFFHTPHWADIFANARVNHMVPCGRSIEFSDGVVAILPLSYKKHLGGATRSYWSMPASCFGGWISRTTLTQEHCRLLIAYLDTFPDLFWRENPYDPVLLKMEIPGAEEDFTQSIDLRKGIEPARASADYSHRRAVKRAREKGVSVVEASNFDQWMSYFSLYTASRDRWKSKMTFIGSGYTLDFLKAVYDSPSAHRKMWLALLDGTPIAGTLCFFWNKHAVSWSTAGIAGLFNSHRPNDLLYDHACNHAAEVHCDWFDCNPSGGLKGVIDFKEHIGAQKLRSRIVDRKSFLRRMAAGIRKVFAR
ncbi:MAG: GNAT family N-acetyltransferase [Chitinispirillaceae bacterium]|nr:GNAT family N-acetyltransferase [Chitinispirillaceae bacterium]